MKLDAGSTACPARRAGNSVCASAVPAHETISSNKVGINRTGHLKFREDPGNLEVFRDKRVALPPDPAWSRHSVATLHWALLRAAAAYQSISAPPS